MTAPSQTPEAAGLEVFGHWVEHTVAEPLLIRPPAFVPAGANHTITPLVTAASAQTAIDAEKTRADRLETDIRFRNERWSAVAARAEKLEQALIEALPYVESCEYDNGYKPGAVMRVVKNIRTVLQQETQP